MGVNSRPALVLLLSLGMLAPVLAGAVEKAAKRKFSTKKAGSPSTPTPSAKKPAPEPEEASEQVSRPAESSPDTKEVPLPAAPVHAPNASLEPADLAEFAAQPKPVQDLLTAALAMTRQNLNYQYGSADPAKGGMDCSGTIYFLLRSRGLPEVPRDSSSQYVWARKGGGFQAVVSKSIGSFELKSLRPGDLMFWSGTYQSGREIPISHVMLYLGTEKRTGKPVMFGASDGRSYNGIGRWGVSVFDFKMPKAEEGQTAKVDFIGYAPIPGLRGLEQGGTEGEGFAQEGERAKPTPAPARPRTRARKTAESSE